MTSRKRPNFSKMPKHDVKLRFPNPPPRAKQGGGTEPKARPDKENPRLKPSPGTNAFCLIGASTKHPLVISWFPLGPLGVTWCPFGLHLVPIWSPLGPIWSHLVSIFGPMLAPFPSRGQPQRPPSRNAGTQNGGAAVNAARRPQLINELDNELIKFAVARAC